MLSGASTLSMLIIEHNTVHNIHLDQIYIFIYILYIYNYIYSCIEMTTSIMKPHL